MKIYTINLAMLARRGTSTSMATFFFSSGSCWDCVKEENSIFYISSLCAVVRLMTPNYRFLFPTLDDK
jgi:hypothetical protein